MGRLDEEARVMNDTGLFCGESDSPDFASYVVRCDSRAILVDLAHWDSINMVISENYFMLTFRSVMHDYFFGMKGI
jgi:hypothetical protein